MPTADSVSELHQAAKSAPRLPGVYLFKNSAGAVLYVGKALSLRDRLANYFGPNVPDKTRLFLTKAKSIETLICGSEYEAFMLEYTLIKEHRPPFNIVFRDDKRYPYIKITGGDFPRIIVTRRVEDDGGRYFGPYVSGLNVRRVIELLHRLFKIRTCKRKLVEGKKSPPLCLQYHIKRCDGPCESLVSKSAYGEQIDRAGRFLRGQYAELIEELKSKMREAAGGRSFELAALYRDQLAAIQELAERQRAATARERDLDAVAFVHDPNHGRICFYVFKIRKGHIIGSAGFVFPFLSGTESDALSNFITEFYRLPGDVPREIALASEPAQIKSLSKWLNQNSGRAVRLWVPQKAYAKDLILLAEKNARAKLYEKADPQMEELLDRVREKLQLARRPERVHGYDVANLGPGIVTGSRVMFVHGRPDKSLYRAYGLRTGDIKDDYAAMEELVGRSIRRAVEQEPAAIPDLLLIDGGLGHVRAARRAIRAYEPSTSHAPLRRPQSPAIDRPAFEIVGLAKDEELLILEDGKVIKLGKGDPVLNFFQRVRDEAHRFSRRLMATRAKKKMIARKK